MAKCISCGYVLWTKTRYWLTEFMKQHDAKSHNTTDSEDYDFCTWVIAPIDNKAYAMLNVASKSPAFWKAVRTSPKTL